MLNWNTRLLISDREILSLTYFYIALSISVNTIKKIGYITQYYKLY